MATVERPRRGVRGLADQANPAFAAAVVVVPLAALSYALLVEDARALQYVHIMAGGLWTGIDVFMGFVLGPVLGGMSEKQRAAIYSTLVPKMTFLMPVLATVTITGGVYLAQWLGYWPASGLGEADPIVHAALGVAGLLTIIGFGVILPNEVRVYRELVSADPDEAKISRLGMRNAKLGGVQGVLQLLIIFLMASFQFGGIF